MPVFVPGAADLQHQFEKTKEVTLAAQAIGQFPDDPPKWAMLACIEYANKIARDRDTNDPDGADGYVLDEMIRVMFADYDREESKNEGSSFDYKPLSMTDAFNSAILTVEGLSEDDLTYRSRYEAVRRRWKHMKDERPDVATPQGVPQCERYDRMAAEWCEENWGGPEFVYSQKRFLERGERGDSSKS